MSEIGTETPRPSGGRIRSWAEKMGFVRSSTPQADASANLLRERSLSRDQFVVDQAETQRLQTEAVNLGAVAEGKPDRHLIDTDESVVSFTGTPDQFVELVAQLQQNPVREVNSDTKSTRSEGQEVGLSKTGLEVVCPADFLKAAKSNVINPSDTSGNLDRRMEIIGVSVSSRGDVVEIFATDQENSITEVLPRHISGPDKNQLAQQYHEVSSSARSLEREQGAIHLWTRNPLESESRRALVQEAWDKGDIIYTSSFGGTQSSGGMTYYTGSPDRMIHMMPRIPDREKSLSHVTTRRIILSPDEVKDFLARVVVPTKAIA